MVSRKIIQNLEHYINQTAPTILDTYQKFSETSLESPRILVKDKLGFFQDYIMENLKNYNNPDLNEKILQVLELSSTIEDCDFEKQRTLLDHIAYQVILGEEDFKKMKSAKTYEDFIEITRNSKYSEQLDIWSNLFFGAEEAIPGIFNSEIDGAECLMFVKPEMNMQTMYILEWKGDMTKQEKPKDAVKMFLVHEYIHLLNQQLGKLTSFRKDTTLDIEERIVFKWLDEGLAEFFALDIFSHIYDNPRFPSKVIKNMKKVSRIFGIVNTVMNFYYKEKEINPHKFRIQSYQLLKKVNKKYGLEEIFRIIKNPHLISMEEIQKPRKYIPIEERV